MPVKNFFLYLSSNIVNAGVPLALIPILTRLLDAEDYGLLYMFTLLVTYFGALTGFSAHGAVGVRYFQYEVNKLAEYIFSLFILLTMSLIVLAISLIFLSSWIHELTNIPFCWIYLALVAAYLNFIINIRLALWQASKAAKQYAIFQVSQSVFGAMVAIVLLFGYAKSWESRSISIIVANIVFSAIGLIKLIKEKLIRFPKNCGKDIIDALQFGVPLIPHVIGGLLISTGDRLIVSSVLGANALGIYAIAAQLGSVIKLIGDAYVKFYGPWLNEKLLSKTEESKEVIVGSVYLSWLVFLIITVALHLVLKYIFDFIVGPGFDSAKHLLPYILIGFCLKCMYLALAGLYFFSSKTGEVSKNTIFSGLIGLIVSFALIASVGLVGAGIGFVVSGVLAFFLGWYRSLNLWVLPWLRPVRCIQAFGNYVVSTHRAS